MGRRLVIPGLLLAALAAAAVLAAGRAAPRAAFAARAVTVDPEVSTNWAGYAVTSLDAARPVAFADVTGTWVHPQARCDTAPHAAAAFWVGLGGFDERSQTLEQIGTEVQCVRGVPVHRVWYELVPDPQVAVRLVVRPGDTVTAAVVVAGDQVTLQLKNVTRRTRFTKVLRAPQPLDVSSAEWIAEAPSICSSTSRCRIVPLADFGTVSFARAAAIGDGHAGTISDEAWQTTPIRLSTDSGETFGGLRGGGGLPSAGALPGALSADGRGFSVAFQAQAS